MNTHGGLTIIWIYTGTQISHLLNMLNNDERNVKGLSHSSLFLDIKRHKMPFAGDLEPHFLGFNRKLSRKLDTLSAGFGFWSEWLDLNDLFVQTSLFLEWARDSSGTLRVSESLITDPLTNVRETIT